MSTEGLNSLATEPLILAIETGTRAGGVAIARGEEILASRLGDASSSHSQDLIENIDAVLKEAGVELSTIDLLAAAIGPGSFTGLRIGLATAKSLAVSLDRRCVGVSTLAAVSHAAGVAERTVALLPAGRGEVFAQMFAVRDDEVEPLDEPAHISPNALIAKYGRYPQLTWAGEGAHAQLELIRGEAQAKGIELKAGARAEDTNGWMLAPPSPGLAADVAKLASREWRKGNVIDPEELRANYVRASDAEIKTHA
ncbi:MAG: tRNA (adenosine(37)-N6)-threonylcarbamoyltransferase complex dimerization subunit type 1 TsaB [Pyrinomonadaceae bacterium]